MVRLTLLLASMLIAAVFGGCATNHYGLHAAASGIVPVPAGPVAAGPLGEPGHVSLEGSISQSYVTPAAPTVAADGGEARVLRTVARGRVAYTFRGGVEVGVSVHAGDPGWQTVVARGTGSPPIGERYLVGAGLQGRAIVLGDATRGLGLLGEISLTSAPYQTRVDFVHATHSLDGTMTSEGARDFAASSFLFEPSAGVFGVISPLRRLRVTAGATIGVHSVVRTAYTASVSCSDDASELPAWPLESSLALHRRRRGRRRHLRHHRRGLRQPRPHLRRRALGRGARGPPRVPEDALIEGFCAPLARTAWSRTVRAR